MIYFVAAKLTFLFYLNVCSNIVECWKVLATDTNIMIHIFDNFLDRLIRNIPYDEKIDLKTKKTIAKYAMLVPLAVSSNYRDLIICRDMCKDFGKSLHFPPKKCLTSLDLKESSNRYSHKSIGEKFCDCDNLAKNLTHPRK